METVHNVAEAEAFFAANEGVEVIAENDNKVTKVVTSFADARDFFEGETAGESTDEVEAADAGSDVAGGQMAADGSDNGAESSGDQGQNGSDSVATGEGQSAGAEGEDRG